MSPAADPSQVLLASATASIPKLFLLTMQSESFSKRLRAGKGTRHLCVMSKQIGQTGSQTANIILLSI